MEALNKLERILDVPRKTKKQILAELRSHLEDAKEELIEAGATPEQATLAAAERLGPPDELAGDFLAVYGPGWKSFLLILAPFFMALLGRYHRTLIWSHFTQAVDTLLALVCLAMVTGTVWGIVQRRKPAWLSSWLVGSFLASFWLSERLNLLSGGAAWVYGRLWGFGVALLPATLNLWFYRRKPSLRPYVFALWVTSSTLVLITAIWPLPWFWPSQSRIMTPEMHRSILLIVAVSGLRNLLVGAAAMMFAAAMAPRGKDNWAIYCSLSTLMFLTMPVWWAWPLPGYSGSSTGFWVSSAVGPIAIWVLLYARKTWMKIGVLASGVAVFWFASLAPHRLARPFGWDGIWDAALIALTVLNPLFQIAIVITPLLLWRRLKNEAGDLRMAAK